MAESLFPFDPSGDDQDLPRTRYANGVDVLVSQFDFSFDFVESLPMRNADGEITVRRRPIDRIVMSPQHAKALAVLLTKHVAGYEADYGELPLTPDLEPGAGPPQEGSSGSGPSHTEGPPEN